MANPTPALDDELLEREDELRRLDRAVQAAASGAGSVVAIEGEAGIGKSTLLARGGRRACDSGMRVLRARGGELERGFAYGVVRQLFELPLAAAEPDHRARWLSGAAGLAGPAVSASALTRATEAEPILHGLYWLSANLAAESPLCILVDDAHWADDASIAFLSYLARRVHELAALVVYAARSGEGASRWLPAVAEPALAGAILHPAALSERATAAIVARLLDRQPATRFARACHIATNGNPFLLEELLRALSADGIAPDDSNSARVEHIVPRTIGRATLARLRALGPNANELAFAVAVLGKSAHLRHAAELAALDADAASRAADALTAAAILGAGRPLEFIHPIVRSTIYDELAPGRRAAAHLRAARMLAADGASDVALAPHLLATEPAGDAWVAEHLRGAADEALERGAPDAARAYLERVVREPPPPADRAGLLLTLGWAEFILGRAEAIEHFRAVIADSGDPSTRLLAAERLVWALSYVGRAQEAASVAGEVLAAVPTADRELMLLIEAGHASTAQFVPAYAKTALERIAHYATELPGDTPGERRVLACLAWGAAHGDGTAAHAADLARRAIGDGRLLLDGRTGDSPFYQAVYALLYAHELDDAERWFARATARAREQGSSVAFTAATGSRGQVLVRQGRLAEAEAEAYGALADTELHHAFSRPMLQSTLMYVMAERADAATADAFLRTHAIDGDLGAAPLGGMLMLARGCMRLALGSARAALDDFEQLHARDELSGLHTPGIPLSANRALAHLQLGARDTARALAAQEHDLARRWDTATALQTALRTLGLVTGGDDGIDLLRAAIGEAERSPARLEHAVSLIEYGAALRRAGHRSDARAPLREGLDLADRCGATRLAGRARDELIATGARPRRTALRGRDALTPSERRVASLATEGLGNREIAQALFVTVRTVEGHLTQAYSKLGITSRDELARVLRAAAA